MIEYVRFADLPVVDQDRAIAFYTDTLGLRLANDAPYQEGWRWVELEVPNARTRIILTKKVETDEPGGFIFVVDDVAAVHRKLAERGVAFTQEPAPAPWNARETHAIFSDSEGNGIVIVSA